MKKVFLSLLIIMGTISCSQAQKTEFSQEALAEKLVTLDGNEIAFQDILEKHKGKTVVLDFWASWCTNCEEISASLESADLSGVVLLQVDMTNTNAEISAILDEYKVFNPPTILFFKNGVELGDLRVVGEISRQNLHSVINSL